MKRHGFGLSLLILFIAGASLPAAPIVSTVTFQHGVSGYTDVLDRKIGPTAGNEVSGSAVNTDATSYFLDGGATTLNDSGATQGLLRFDNIVGGAGVPAGAKVISATVDLVTGNTSNAQTGGAYNLYRLSTAFTDTSSWATTFGGDGLAGDVGEILGSFDGIATAGNPASARADTAVQKWVDGAPNLGFGIRSDRNTDGWSPHTTGSATVAKRPKLTVNYTTDPLVEITSYQNGVNSYSGATDIRLNASGGVTLVGSATQEAFIDGFQADPVSLDQPYLVRFDGIHLNYAEIYKAELIMKSGFGSADADSPGPITVHQMLQDWTTATTYADLDTNSDPTLTDANELMGSGKIGAAAASVTGMNDTEVIHIDVTSIVENWRAGQPNYGLYLGTTGTTNGWQIFLTGALEAGFRPELRIIGVVPEPTAALLLLFGVMLSLAPRFRAK